MHSRRVPKRIIVTVSLSFYNNVFYVHRGEYMMYMFIFTHLPAICLKNTNGCALQESVYVVLIKFKSSELIKTMVMYTFHYRVDRIKCAPYRDNFQLFAAHSLVADYNTRGLLLPQYTVDLILFIYALI